MLATQFEVVAKCVLLGPWRYFLGHRLQATSLSGSVTITNPLGKPPPLYSDRDLTAAPARERTGSRASAKASGGRSASVTSASEARSVSTGDGDGETKLSPQPTSRFSTSFSPRISSPLAGGVSRLRSESGVTPQPRASDSTRSTRSNTVDGSSSSSAGSGSVRAGGSERGSRGSKPVKLYPLFVEGVTEYSDKQLWNMDPVFNKLDIVVLLATVAALVGHPAAALCPRDLWW